MSDRLSEEEFERLLDARSLGTPGAKALATMTPPEHCAEILRRIRAMDEAGVDIDELVPPSPELLAAIDAQLRKDEQLALEHPEQFE